MAYWQKSIVRQLPKTKDELRQMLADAVRNTQSPDQRRKQGMKSKELAARVTGVD
jgi:hypothetical protein